MFLTLFELGIKISASLTVIDFNQPGVNNENCNANQECNQIKILNLQTPLASKYPSTNTHTHTKYNNFKMNQQPFHPSHSSPLSQSLISTTSVHSILVLDFDFNFD